MPIRQPGSSFSPNAAPAWRGRRDLRSRSTRIYYGGTIPPRWVPGGDLSKAPTPAPGRQPPPRRRAAPSSKRSCRSRHARRSGHPDPCARFAFWLWMHHNFSVSVVCLNDRPFVIFVTCHHSLKSSPPRRSTAWWSPRPRSRPSNSSGRLWTTPIEAHLSRPPGRHSALWRMPTTRAKARWSIGNERHDGPTRRWT